MTVSANFNALASIDFWIGVGVIAGIYGIFTLGLQLNAGNTGILNLGQAGFMAVGAYATAILVMSAGFSLWLALPLAILITVIAGVLVGIPSLRLRADYFAITTLAFSEITRMFVQNSRELTGGNQGILGYDAEWIDLSTRLSDWLSPIGLGEHVLLPLLLITWATFLLSIAILRWLQNSPWGRLLRAIREDEDAVQALGKNTFLYKLQSLALAAALAGLSGFLLAVDLAFLSPDQFDPTFTFLGYVILIFGGLGSYRGVALGAVVVWLLHDGTRFIELPLSDERVAALRSILAGLALILLVAFRPQGLLGKREELVLRD